MKDNLNSSVKSMLKIQKISSNPVKYILNSNYRVTLYSTSLVRVEYSKEVPWEEENPLMIEPEFNEEVNHKIEQVDNFFVLQTENFKLKILPNGGPFDIGTLYFTVFDTFNGKNITWQPGIIDEQNLGGGMLDLVKFPEGKQNEKFTEGLISKNGYFIYRNPCVYLWDKKTNWIKGRKDWVHFQDWYLFGYGKKFKNAFLDFIKLFGRIPLLPKWAFGYWYSKWHKFKDTDILELIKKYREHEIPIDVFIIDTDWRKHAWNGYEWNKDFFPNYKKFIQDVKNQNVHIGLNDHPGYGVADPLPEDDPFKEKIKIRIPDIKDYRCNWFDKRYVDAWVEEIFVKFLEDGIDFWWVDGWGTTPVFPGFPSQTWVNKFYFESAKKTTDNRRPMILSRWGGIGAHKYPVQFSGDTLSSFETLKYQISFTHKGGNVGAVYWSHDIGGFFGRKIPEDLYIRWVQYGCFSPIFRTHSCIGGGVREPWEYSNRAVEIFRKYVRIRYALFPYFYTLSRECFDKGLPIIRGLYLQYPNDKNSYIFNEEYLIGEFILVAPAYGPGEVFEREIYFPDEIWISLEDKGIVKGPCKKKIKIPIEKIPVYIKTGAIIPTYPVKENLADKVSEIEFNIFPDDKTEFTYYEDDGLTQKYLDGEFFIQKIKVNKTKKEIRIEISPGEGNYTNCPEEVVYNLNIFIDKNQPKSVYINNKETELKYTNQIFSQTVSSLFKFLRIEIKDYNRRNPLKIVIKNP